MFRRFDDDDDPIPSQPQPVERNGDTRPADPLLVRNETVPQEPNPVIVPEPPPIQPPPIPILPKSRGRPTKEREAENKRLRDEAEAARRAANPPTHSMSTRSKATRSIV